MGALSGLVSISVLLLTTSEGTLGIPKPQTHISRRSAIVFPDSEFYRTAREIPLAMIQRLNDVSNMTEFFDMFVQQEPASLDFSSISGMRPVMRRIRQQVMMLLDNGVQSPNVRFLYIAKTRGSCWRLRSTRRTSRNVELILRVFVSVYEARLGQDEEVERRGLLTAKMAVCMPENQTVSLRPENEKSTFYYPSCTRVERCGGCCSHELLSCQPVTTEILQYGVIVTEYRGGSQLKLRGKEIVEVERHTKCKCDCKVKAEDCKPYQRYSKESCRCVCGNKDKEQKCLEERSLKLWNPNECACVCKDELECSTGFYFDRFQCSCKPIRGQKRNSTSTNPNTSLDRLNYSIDN